MKIVRFSSLLYCTQYDVICFADATLNFERSRVFLIEEGGPARVCVAVTDPTGLGCPVAYPIDLLISVTDGTASE